MRAGFSLLELSIVLVIIGLLAGGVMTGQSLIRAAELRSVTADFNRFQTALYSFRDKYAALPGDMKNATLFWGAAHSNAVTCRTTQGIGVQTCDGNGDGRMDTVDSSVTFSERFRAWQQLANAGLLEGSYTGISAGAAANDRMAGVNVPASKLSNAYFEVFAQWYAISGDPQYFDGPAQNVISISGQNKAMNPAEAWSIDTKLDDGQPANGRIFVLKGSSTWMPGCATTDVNATAQYALTSTAFTCSPHMGLR